MGCAVREVFPRLGHVREFVNDDPITKFSQDYTLAISENRSCFLSVTWAYSTVRIQYPRMRHRPGLIDPEARSNALWVRCMRRRTVHAHTISPDFAKHIRYGRRGRASKVRGVWSRLEPVGEFFTLFGLKSKLKKGNISGLFGA